jgi:hypothetical protein
VGPDSIKEYATLRIPHLALNLIQIKMAGEVKVEWEFGWEKECLELDRVLFVRLVIFFNSFASLSLGYG